MSVYTVIPTVWPVSGRAFRRGDRVTDDQLGGRADSYRRLGLITPVMDTSGTKKELVERAELLGVAVPKTVTKAQLVEMIEKETHRGV